MHQIMRATGDAPLVSPTLAESAATLHLERGADLSHFINCPLGTGVEIICADSLQVARRESRDPFEREHITQFFYRDRNRFLVVEEPCPASCSLLGSDVTIDTEEDYRFVQQIYDDLYRYGPIETVELVSWLRKY